MLTFKFGITDNPIFRSPKDIGQRTNKDLQQQKNYTKK